MLVFSLERVSILKILSVFWHCYIGDGRSLKAGRQDMEVWGRAPSGFQGQRPHSGGLRAKPPEADDTSCENMLFGDGFKNDIAIYAFIAYKCSAWNGRKINLLKTRWNYLGCPKLTKRSQPLVGQVHHIARTCGGDIVDTCLSCEDIARQSCAMVPRWRLWWHFCVLYLPRAASSTFQTCILNSH